MQAEQASGGSPEATEAYCRELLAGAYAQGVVPAALSSSDSAADNALSVVVGTLSSISKQGAALLPCCIVPWHDVWLHMRLLAMRTMSTLCAHCPLLCEGC